MLTTLLLTEIWARCDIFLFVVLPSYSMIRWAKPQGVSTVWIFYESLAVALSFLQRRRQQ